MEKGWRRVGEDWGRGERYERREEGGGFCGLWGGRVRVYLFYSTDEEGGLWVVSFGRWGWGWCWGWEGCREGCMQSFSLSRGEVVMGRF